MDKNEIEEIIQVLDERAKAKEEAETKAFLKNKHTYIILALAIMMVGTYFVVKERHLEVLAVITEVSIASLMHILWGIWEESKKPTKHKRE